MIVTIADKLPPVICDELEASGCEVHFAPSLSASDLDAGLPESEVLIVRSTVVTERAINASPMLNLIIRAGAGVNNIDLGAASVRGIAVANCPGKNAVAVAELAMGLLLAVDRRIPDCTAALRRGEWDKKRFADGRGLLGRTLGVAGTGKIGEALIERAQAFGMRVKAWSRSLTSERAALLGVTHCADLASLVQDSDVISVHLASAPETRKLFGADLFGAMKRGAIFINCARGQIVDQDALLDAMNERGIRAGLDVFEAEPSGGRGLFEHPIKDHPNLVATHHLGASTAQATTATAQEALRVIQVFMQTGDVVNCVNIRSGSSIQSGIVVRHEDRVGVLAAVLDVLKRGSYNIEEMTNRIFSGGHAASAKIMLDRPASTEVMNQLETACGGVIRVTSIR